MLITRCALMVKFSLGLCCVFPASGSRGLIRLRFDPFGKMAGAVGFFHGRQKMSASPTVFCSLQLLILAVWIYQFTGDCTLIYSIPLIYSNCTILISFLSCHHLIRIDSPSNYDSLTQRYSSRRKTGVNVWFFPLIYPLLKNWFRVIFQK